MPARFDLFTLDFKRFQPGMGTPVRTSNGYPRFVKFKMPHAVKEVMPAYPTIKMTDRDKFRELYRDKLNGHGLDVIASRFRAIAVAEDEPRLVLMCYEDLTKPGLWCHRTLFAEWWTEQTGDEVRELSPPPEPKLASLF